VVQVAEHARRAVGVFVDQKHQPRHPRTGRGLELQLGVGQRRLVTDRRAVAEPHDYHVHLGIEHPLPAQLSRRQISGGEVGHIHDRVTGPGNPTLRRSDKRPRHRMIAQL